MIRKLAGVEYEIVLVQDIATYNHVISVLESASIVVVDLETTGLEWHGDDKIAGIALYVPGQGAGYYLPFRHGDTNNLPLDLMDPLKPLLTSPSKVYYTWNGKFDYLFLQSEGFPVLENLPRVYDVMLALHLLDENRLQKGKNYKLKDCAREFVDPTAAEADEDLKGELRARGIPKGQMAELPSNLVAEYAVMDVILTWQMYITLSPFLDKWGVRPLFEENNLFLIRAALRMEYNGFHVDRNLIERHIEETDVIVTQLEAQLHERAGYPINANSPKQVAMWLGLPNAQHDTLEAIADTNDNASLILQYKVESKAVSTFYRPYLRMSKYDGRVHPSINLAVARTGRLSSSGPNLQQVPRKGKKYRVKDVFIAPPGYTLVQADYGQLELRLACFFAKELGMTKMFNDGTDLHQFTADALGVSRYIGKTSNFGLLYGMGPDKASRMLGVPLNEARRIVTGWHDLYPSFKRALNNMMSLAQQWRNPDGTKGQPKKSFQYIRLPDGRVRHYFDGGFFGAWNSLVQGTGWIIMRRALLRIVDKYPPADNRVIPILTVHDSGLFYVLDSALDEVLPVMVDYMVDFPEFNPSMTVDVQIGKSWGALTSTNFMAFVRDGIGPVGVREIKWPIRSS